jgi:hypothetical protein
VWGRSYGNFTHRRRLAVDYVIASGPVVAFFGLLFLPNHVSRRPLPCSPFQNFLRRGWSYDTAAQVGGHWFGRLFILDLLVWCNELARGSLRICGRKVGVPVFVPGVRSKWIKPGG